MPHDDDEDLYDEEFDFVDDDDDEEDAEDDREEASAEGSDIAEEPADEREPEPRDVKPRAERAPVRAEGEGEVEGEEEEPVDEYGRPETTPANYVVHLYDQKKFSRTIDRPFTPEDAEAFASEFNRTSKNYGRFAVTGKNDAKPKKTLD